MANFSGSMLYAQWVYSGGTVELQGNFRNFGYTPAIDLIETSAGSDPNKTYLPSLKDGNVTWASVMQSSETSLQTALAEGTEGTLTVGVEGTASGKPKMILPAIAMGANYAQPYNDIVELSCSWQQNGARTDSTWGA